jgi:hypothetical protein
MKKILYLFLVTSIFLSSCSEESLQPEESSQPMDIENAMSKIKGYFKENLLDQIVILIGKDETLISDLNQDVIDGFNSQLYVDSLGGPSHPNNLRHTEIITHYEEGTHAFIALPAEIQEAVKFINDLKIMGKLKDGVAVEHVIGTATATDMKLLIVYGYGIAVELAPGTTSIYMFMSDSCWKGIFDLTTGILNFADDSRSVIDWFVLGTSECDALIESGPEAVFACEVDFIAVTISSWTKSGLAVYKGGREVNADC